MSVRASVWIGFAMALALWGGACDRGAREDASAGESVSTTVEGEQISVTATIASSSVTMAEIVRLELVVRTERDDVASVDVSWDESDEQWAEIRRERSKEGWGEGRGSEGAGTSVRSTLLLEPFLPGELGTPLIGVTPVLRDGGRGEVLSIEPIVVTVGSVIEEDPQGAELADVKGVEDAPAVSRALLIAGIVVAGLGALAAIVAGIVMMRRGGEEVVVVRPAHEIALEALERLRERGLVESGLMKEFYFQLSRILRRYIEDRFGLHAPEQTTEEFLRDARGAGALGTQDVELLERFLEHCDMVKFAKLDVMRDQAESSMTTVGDFIGRTRVVEMGVPGGQGAGASVREAAA